MPGAPSPPRQAMPVAGKGAGALVVRAKRVDPKLLKAVKNGHPEERLTVMVKLGRATSVYASLPVSNAEGNERARVFSSEVDSLLTQADHAHGTARIVEEAPNVGVATLEASVGAVRELLAFEQLEGLQLLQSF